jgi:YD repeat-containing protein
MHVKTSSLAHGAVLLCAFALLSCTASTDETGRAEAASTVEDAGSDSSTPPSLFAGGAGTEASPYQVASCAQLQALETAPYSHFVLTADIDCTGFDAGDGMGFRPIGSDEAEFGGRVNGQGHVITGLRIARPSQHRVGLFGRTRWAVLLNFGLVSPTIEGRDDVGALIGWQRWGLVEQVSVRDAAVTGRDRVGALVGHMHHSKVYNSYARAGLTCTKWDDFNGGGRSRWNRSCGQLVGTTVHGIVVNSYAAVDAAPHFGLAGGSAPRTHTAAFYDCDVVAGCTAPHVERRTTSQLQSEAYLVAQHWDFLSVWDIAALGTYPCLQWEPGCSEPTCAPTDVTCDGVDDDCNGTADEDFAPAATSCGAGVCGSTGATSCVAGAVVDSCEASAATGTDADCDGVDNDCDASVDEAYVPTGTSCGVGACGASGSTSCVSGAVVDSCEAGTPAGPDATCNGQDNDCDGDVDEAYAPTATSCGVGACGATGATSCVSGVVVDSCEAGAATGADADCDEIDNDCDASTDEAYAPTATSCGVGSCGATGATSCVSGAVVDSCEAGTPTGTDATCNGQDDDCDGDVDEAYAPTATSCGVGACGATGATSCVSGVVVDSCEAGAPTGADADCDGIDNDCDASTDEAYVPTATSCGVGACGATGATSCVSGAVVDSCEAGTPTGTDATCNGQDDDCDGDVDEAYAPTATSCGVGACGATGATACVSGVVVDSCDAGAPTGADADCDGIDNDCDASTDEAYVPTATSCGVGACGATGATSCVSGAAVDSCEAGTPAGADATCNGQDDDCDGDVDEAYAPTATSCGVGACGATGATACVSGAVADSCEAGAGTGADSDCDGVDNDCDGTADEGFASSATSCGVGACGATGATSCVSGAVVDSCEAGTPAGTDATCDGLDDDCDGDVDEAYSPTATSCGVGACGATGATSCVSGAVVDSCVAGAATGADADCDGMDNDCDASTDEAYAPTATSCGVGVCGATGSTNCVSGEVVDSCESGTPAGTDASCDGQDEDCDGEVDEAFAPAATSCGIGACGAIGATSCVSGAVVDSCEAGTATGTDADCDGADSDCDASVDEGYAPTGTSCGVGACHATGATSCVSGAVADSCEPGTPLGADATCNAVDDDCDGAMDEAFAPGTTNCGVGACAATGATSCVAGTVLDSCQVGPVTGIDEVCDGVDEDCDGRADEAFFEDDPTICGVGACEEKGEATCVSGVRLDSCVPLPPALTDDTCDYNDEDCDGATDEGFAPTGPDDTCDGFDEDCDGFSDEGWSQSVSSCGVGVCSAHGETTCFSGVVHDSCEQGLPTGTDTTCDGLDDDCDAFVDEGFVPVATTCGHGVCRAVGTTSCVAGAEVDLCEVGAPTGTDTTCNGVDEDCDGSNDEAYAPVATDCGLGACHATGATSCASGTVDDSCEAGTPSAADTTCNGLDDDCDGSLDEGFVPVETGCGSGVCGARGQTACHAGAIHDSCAPGAPTGDDDDCNGLDDDCDGLADESYVVQPTSCGSAECVATGSLICLGATFTDTCTTPGVGHASGCLGCRDGVDNDSNGVADCADPACAGEISCLAEYCSNYTDDDGDGFVDCDDYECWDSTHCKLENCIDTVDNDADGNIDCLDADCDGVPPCAVEVCSDRLDNDGDGLSDCADQQCAGSSHCGSEVCTNRFDDDGDGRVDCRDDECSSGPDCFEFNCTDNEDNDQDGRIDCADMDCIGTSSCQIELCANNLDDDGDGSTDCSDGDCSHSSACIYETCDDGHDNDGNARVDCADIDCVDSPLCFELPEEPSGASMELRRNEMHHLMSLVSSFIEGPSPIQKGFDLNALQVSSVSWIRGRVIDNDGLAIAGVTVSVLDHPEFGATRTRENGWYDLVTWGGGQKILRIQKIGFADAQRRVTLQGQDSAHAEPVVLLPESDWEMTVQMNSPQSVDVLGPTSIDDSGSRTPLLVFRPGTRAIARTRDGRSLPLEELEIRATEFTVGDRGLLAMPGELPESTAYTYAIDFTVDQAADEGAHTVEFSQPVAFYIENFIDAPVGITVPVGSYDRESGYWIAEPNGVVISIVDVQGGVAIIDLNGDGSPDPTLALVAAGIHPDELVVLGTQYEPGASLWRVELSHFTPFDCNYAPGPPPGASPPPEQRELPREIHGDCESEGSTIYCDSQSLGESIPASSTSLHYRSDRAAPTGSDYSTSVTLTGDAIPSPLEYARIRTSVAGRQLDTRFERAQLSANFEHVVNWDGRDALGREVNGSYNATIEICYGYTWLFYGGFAAEPAFAAALAGETSSRTGSSPGSYANAVTFGDATRNAVSPLELCRVVHRSLGRHSHSSVAGWTLPEHHALDPMTSELHLGSGRSIRLAPDQTRPSQQIALLAPWEWNVRGGMSAGPDGEFYGWGNLPGAYPESLRTWVFRLSIDGSNQRIIEASGEINCYNHGFCAILGVEASQHGLFVLDVARNSSGIARRRLSKLSIDGEISRLHDDDFTGSSMEGNRKIAVDVDENVYIQDRNGGVIRIDPAGRPRNVIGQPGYDCERRLVSAPALDVCASGIRGIDSSPSGRIYVYRSFFSQISVFEYIRGTGELELVATHQDPEASSMPHYQITDLAPSDDYFLVPRGWDNQSGSGLSLISRYGDFVPVFGATRYSETQEYDGASLSDVRLSNQQFAGGPGGLVFETDDSSPRVVHMEIPRFTARELEVVSPDGAEVFVFSREGRHEATYSALTGAILRRFYYRSDGQLSSVEDGVGNVTHVEYDSSGRPIAVSDALSFRSQIEVGAGGQLSASIDGLGRRHEMTYEPATGLLATFRTPMGRVSSFGYDSNGRLVQDLGADGRVNRLERTELADGHQVLRSVDDGLAYRYTTRTDESSGEVVHSVHIDGVAAAQSLESRGVDGTVSRVDAGGTSVQEHRSAHPIFGLRASYVDSSVVTTPGGRTLTTSTNIQALPIGPTMRSGLLSERRVATDPGGGTWTTDYNATTRVLRMESPEGRLSSMTLDPLGRAVDVQSPGLHPTRYTYDGRGRVMRVEQGPAGFERVIQHNYLDAATGREHWGPVRSQLPGEALVEARYDATGWVTQRSRNGVPISMTYDLDGQIESVTPPSGDTHGFAYTARRGTLNSHVYPGLEDESERRTEYQYDTEGRLSSLLLPNGESVEWSVDAHGRASSVTWSSGTTLVSYAGTARVPQRIADPDGVVLTFSHDGPLMEAMTWAGPVNGHVEFGFDASWRTERVGVTGGEATTYTRDADGLITRAASSGGSELEVVRDDETGRVEALDIGVVHDAYVYDGTASTPGFGDLTSRSIQVGDDELLVLAYQYDDASPTCTTRSAAEWAAW